MEDMAKILHAIAWPVTILIILATLGRELRKVLGNAAERVRTAATLKVGKGGIELRGLVEAVNARVTAVEARQDHVVEKVFQPAARSGRDQAAKGPCVTSITGPNGGAELYER
jgi:hypothetical protein